MPLNYMVHPPTAASAGNWPNVMGFRSRHPGGAQFCFADGSVRFLRQGINHNLYRALSTKKGGEPIQIP
jgi:prepilin-type processing-associated H-X9-DG protein